VVREVTLELGPSECTLVDCVGPDGSLDGCCNTCSAERRPKHTNFRSMEPKEGPAFRCYFGECEPEPCTSETERHELVGKVSDDGEQLTEVELRKLAR